MFIPLRLVLQLDSMLLLLRLYIVKRIYEYRNIGIIEEVW